MLANGVFVSIAVVLDTDAPEVALLEDAVFNKVFPVEATDTLEGVIEVLAYTNDAIFLEDEAVPLALVEAFLIPKQSFVP